MQQLDSLDSGQWTVDGGRKMKIFRNVRFKTFPFGMVAIPVTGRGSL
jgi:hypothetical protein